MMEYMPELLLVPVIIGLLFLVYKWIQCNYKIKVLRKEAECIKNNNKLIMDSYTANALSTETNTKKIQ